MAEALNKASGQIESSHDSLVFLSQMMPRYNELMAKVRELQEKGQKQEGKTAKIEQKERGENGKLGEKQQEFEGKSGQIFEKHQTVIWNNKTIERNKAEIEKLKNTQWSGKWPENFEVVTQGQTTKAQKWDREGSSEIKNQIEELQEANRKLEAANEALKSDIQRLTQEAENLQKDIKDIQQTIADLGTAKTLEQQKNWDIIAQKDRTENQANSLQEKIQAEQASNERFATRAHELLAQVSKQIEARPENNYYEKEADAGVWPT